MYGVIMAGGGGTRLHPLSRAERPKPFLPLLGPESLLQATAARLRPLTDDITVVTDRRYEATGPRPAPRRRPLLLEPLGRNTAAAIALATLAIDRPPDEVMVVLPADQTIEREDAFRDVLRAAADHLATGAFGIDDPLVTLGVQPDRAGHRVRLPAAGRRSRRGDRRTPGVSAARLRGEAEPGPGRAAPARDRDRLERGHVPVATAGHPVGPGAVHGPRPDARADGRRRPRCSSAPTNRSRRRCRSTTRSWRAPPATVAS